MNLLGKVTTHIKSTTNLLQLRETIDLQKIGVIGDDDIGLDLGQLGEGKVGDLVVSNDSNSLTNTSKVGSAE